LKSIRILIVIFIVALSSSCGPKDVLKSDSLGENEIVPTNSSLVVQSQSKQSDQIATGSQSKMDEPVENMNNDNLAINQSDVSDDKQTQPNKGSIADEQEINSPDQNDTSHGSEELEQEMGSEMNLITERQYSVISEVISQGEDGQVSTIVGTGTAGQGTYTTDHPRFPAPDDKGNIYFVDGKDTGHIKLRMWDGERNHTILDLAKDKVTRREVDFYTTGVQYMGSVLYFSSEEKLYKLAKDRATEIPEITRYMKKEHFEYIFRTEQYDGKLILMLWRKNWTYAFVSFDPVDKSIDLVLDAQGYPDPTNFFMQGRGISISSETGAVYYEKFFPRKSIDHVDTNMGSVLDTWIDEDENIYYVLFKNKTQYLIYRLPQGAKTLGDEELVAGGPTGFVDGVADQVQMDGATDFTWDGSGMVFADTFNNSIRKLWLDARPLK